jgi:hypothetical protein
MREIDTILLLLLLSLLFQILYTNDKYNVLWKSILLINGLIFHRRAGVKTLIFQMSIIDIRSNKQPTAFTFVFRPYQKVIVFYHEYNYITYLFRKTIIIFS